MYRKDTYDGKYKRLKVIGKKNTLTYTDTNLTKNHEYIYRIRGYVVINNIKYYTDYSIITAETYRAKRAAITLEKTKLLKQPKNNSAVLVTVPKNVTMYFNGHTYLNNKKIYLHYTYTINSKTYDGYLKSDKKIKYYKSGKTSGNLNLRKNNSQEAAILAVIPKNTYIAILDQKADGSAIWYKTKFYNGSKSFTGYVSSSYVK